MFLPSTLVVVFWIRRCLEIAPWSLFNSPLIGQSGCVWRFDELKSRIGRLPPPPTCSATLLSPRRGWGRLLMRFQSHCCSDKAVGKVISVRVLHILLSSHHRTPQLTIVAFCRPCFPLPDCLLVLHKGGHFGLALQFYGALCSCLAPSLAEESHQHFTMANFETLMFC